MIQVFFSYISLFFSTQSGFLGSRSLLLFFLSFWRRQHRKMTANGEFVWFFNKRKNYTKRDRWRGKICIAYIYLVSLYIYTCTYIFLKKNCCCFIGVLVKPWLVVVYSGFVLAAKLFFLGAFRFSFFFLHFEVILWAFHRFCFFNTWHLHKSLVISKILTKLYYLFTFNHWLFRHTEILSSQ